ncbi:MAG: PsbP-related protein, partial [bacterium]|nr:PsbP-related protein [bacterium]
MSSQKGNILIIIPSLIAIIALVTAGYFFFQTQQLQKPKTETFIKDETANWKTYKNSRFVISFDYPNTWVVAEYDGV